MRKPCKPGTPIDAKRYKAWVSRFGSYRGGIINVTVENWLGQFSESDQDLAARVLDSVEFYGQSLIHAAFRETLKSLPGWHETTLQRRGNWRFAAMSGSAGESGDAMLYQFRLANGLTSKQYNELFVSRSDLFRLPMLAEDDPKFLGKDDVVVLLDDFSGTGKQICDAWNDPETSFGALLAGVGRVYIVVVAASKAARQRITTETNVSLLAAHELDEVDNIFSTKCKHFTEDDRAALLRYGKVADKRNPKGYGGCGFVVVFQHRPPNNSIPILHVDHSKWIGLFPRHD